MERNTIQKRQILDVIMNCYTHPTIKELYELVNEKYPNIGQATVYRTINKLVQDDIVIRIDCNDGTHYDYNREHYHFYCLDCGRITDVYLNSNMVDELLSSSKLTEVKCINIVFEGICDNCKKLNKDTC